MSRGALAIALTRPQNALVFGGYTAAALVLGTVLRQVAACPLLPHCPRPTSRAAGRGQVEVGPPKDGSERVVFLAPGLVEMLAAHVAAHSGDGGWMFTGEGDQPPDQTPSATAGAPRPRPPGSPGCVCTASGTSTPRG
jgi:hypothetical protein